VFSLFFNQELNQQILDSQQLMEKILIVDDEPNILLSLEFLMRKEGYQVFIARNGQEALDIIDNQMPSLVLLDIMMPEVDGYEVCRQIKTNERLDATKIIFLSAKTKDADIQKGYEVGANLYLTKPFSTRNLMTKVKELLSN
jgi:DNA-binding response OmpR family regulator